jgi:anthranilate phosphoribosyltransferase
VAKHGGRSVSSTSGSADVLEALGVNVNLTPEKLAEAVKTIGVGFMFAPNHHSAMKHAAPVRRELGVRTLFNLLGPLTNPAGAPNQVLGVFSRELTGILARVLQTLGSRHVLVVHAEEGLDEISLASRRPGSPNSKTAMSPNTNSSPACSACRRCRPANWSSTAATRPPPCCWPRWKTAMPPPAAIVALNAGAAVYTSPVGPPA